jgi:GNAT superfamily N-acetyltransferase
MELGESAEDAAIRECHEETGLLVRVDHLLGVYSYGAGQRTGLLIIYAATATGGELVAADDATEAGVFDLEALPTPMAFPTHIQAIERWRRETRAAIAPYLARTASGAITVRYASQPDAPAALALLLANLAPDSANSLATEALLHDRLHDPDRPALLAELDGTIGGVALLGVHQAPRGWYATLDDLVIAPALRRRGLGRALIEATASLARARGCALLQLAFPTGDLGARAFLAVCGFETGEALALHL